jgi:hypothetical protein
MKKIFAVLSLIAILTVSFTTKASAVDTDNIVYVTSYDSPEFVAVATVDAVSVEGIAVINSVEYTIATIGEDVILPDIELSESTLSNENNNVADSSVNYLEGETNSIAVNTVSIDKDNSNEYADLSTYFGTLSTNSEFIEPLPTLSEYVTNYNYSNGYETPEFLKAISSNIGKLTTFKI